MVVGKGVFLRTKHLQASTETTRTHIETLNCASAGFASGVWRAVFVADSAEGAGEVDVHR